MIPKESSTHLVVVKNDSTAIEKALSVLRDGICLIDRSLKVAYINTYLQKVAQAHIGKKPKVGEHILAHVPKERKPIHQDFIDKAFLGKSSVFDFSYKTRGKEHWMQMEYYPIIEYTGEIQFVCIRAKEITENIELKKKLTKEQEEQNKKIIQATINAEEKQRTQIGRELHDNVNQVLTSIKLYAELCLKEETASKPLIEKIIERTNYCIEEIRSLSRKLSSPSIEEQNLRELMENLVEEIRATQKVAIRFRSIGLNNRQLKQEVQTAIYRIVQEQMTNILKYAEASIVELIIVSIDNEVAIQVQDNGKGFVLNESNKGTGLLNMINRVTAVGGRIEFKTAPGTGCTMTAEFPL